MRKIIRVIPVIIFVSIAFSHVFASDTEIKKQQVVETITSEELMDYVHELTDTTYRGRLAGSPEYMDVADWAAGLFKQWGIEPAGDNGSYYQYFEWPYTEVLSTGEVTLYQDGEATRLSTPDDYYPGSSSFNGSVRQELVFAGYGISAPELGYDDYTDTDVQGKIVMIAGRTPYTGDNPDTLNLWGKYSSPVYKMENAHSQGAAGVLYLNKLASPGMPHFPGFYYAHIDTHVSEQILGKPLEETLEKIRQQGKPQSFTTDFEAEIVSRTRHHGKGTTANVIGYIPGTDPELKEEVIMLGAHLDGQGYLGFHLPGALDNASGVADVLAAARALSEFRGEMKRSVAFILFGAEEVGLVGSTLYCENPVFPSEKTLLFMNLDMVGNGEGLALWHGESYPELLKHFETNNEKYTDRTLRSSKGSMPVGRPRTDGLVFMQHGFRTFHVGTTDRVNPLYYHDPRDTAEHLVPEIMRDVSRMIAAGIVDMANDDSIRADELFLIE